MPLVVLPVLFILVVIALIPISIVQRFRTGTARRPARRWVAALNVIAVALSVILFLIGASITSVWIPGALTYMAAGLALGGALGVFGVWLTRWDAADGRRHFTPNFWLVLAITLVVTARVAYGFWRGWQAWSASLDSGSWVIASGIAGSMWAGAVVLGYYLLFWAGIWRRLRK